MAKKINPENITLETNAPAFLLPSGLILNPDNQFGQKDYIGIVITFRKQGHRYLKVERAASLYAKVKTKHELVAYAQELFDAGKFEVVYAG